MRSARFLIAALAVFGVAAPPAAAQDGLIAFESNRDGPLTEIYTMRPDGSAKTRLTYNRARDISAAWSADGSEIAFSRGLGNWELFRMRADGSAQERLTTTPDDEVNAVWSPDGSQIAFERQRRGADPQIFVLDLGSGSEQHVSAGSSPTWSPDGSQIAYSVRDGADLDVAITDVGTGETQMMTQNTVDDIGAEWAPDGQELAFSRRVGRGAQLVVADLSSGQERVLPTGSLDAFGPAWSPDGGSLAFSASSARDTRRQGEFEILRVDLASGAVIPLTTSYPGRDVAPDWGDAAQSVFARLAQLPPDPPASFCTWTGTNKAETKYGSPYKPDVMCGKAGGDVLYGRGKADTLKAGTGKDVLYGGGGSDDFDTRFDGGGDSVDGGSGADEAWTDCGDYVVNAVERCG